MSFKNKVFKLKLDPNSTITGMRNIRLMIEIKKYLKYIEVVRVLILILTVEIDATSINSRTIEYNGPLIWSINAYMIELGMKKKSNNSI